MLLLPFRFAKYEQTLFKFSGFAQQVGRMEGIPARGGNNNSRCQELHFGHGGKGPLDFRVNKKNHLLKLCEGLSPSPLKKLK